MTTELELHDRPLSQVDEIAESIQSSADAGWDRPTGERQTWDMRHVKEVLQRAIQDTRTLLVASIVAAAVVLVAAVVWGRWGRRPPPKTAEDLLLERSREAFDRARETLETVASKLASLER
jgi:hypothetical protein